MAVTSLPVPMAINGSARNRQYVRLTGRSCEKSFDSDHWPVNRCIYTKKEYIFGGMLLGMQNISILYS